MSEIVFIKDRMDLLNDVIDLGDVNSTTLGFYPRGAYEKSAKENKIILTTDSSSEVLGYLLYSINKKSQFVYIVHLCVEQSQRKQDIASKMLEKLKEETSELLRGIRVRCRKDYDANDVWPKLGFEWKADMPGRSRHGSTLSIWWFDYGKPDLFSQLTDKLDENKLKVAIDMNVFIDLCSGINNHTQHSHSLKADWLLENIELCITSEIFNEIDRIKDKTERAEKNNEAKSYHLIESDSGIFNEVYTSLKQKSFIDSSDSKESDVRQISYAIAARIPVFVTYDKGLLKRNARIKKRYDISIIEPPELVLQQDELRRKYEYQPERLAGTQLKKVRVSSGVIKELQELFYNKKTENKRKFISLLNSVLNKPNENVTQVIKYGKENVGLFSYRISKKALEVKLLRLTNHIIAPTIARYIVDHLINQSIESDLSITKVLDKDAQEYSTDALIEYNFFSTRNGWIRAHMRGIKNIVETLEILASEIGKASDTQQYYEYIKHLLFLSQTSPDQETLLYLERCLWPLKLRALEIPTYIVPIQPIWAMHLFDSDIGAEDLFGSEPTRILNCENVYYRSSKPRIITAPARVLWYVSGSGKANTNTMAIKACSYIDEVTIDMPSTVFRKYERLGIYKWKDVLKVAKGDKGKNIMAFKFSRTERFPKPINLQILRRIWREQDGKNFHIQAPILINQSRFHQLYELATSPT